jgi:hypothetical protein
MKKTIIAHNLANISHLEMVLSYVYYLSDTDSKVSLSISFQNSIGDKNVLSKEVLREYKLPDSVDVCDDVGLYDYPDVYICNFGRLVAHNVFESRKYKHFQAFVRMDEGSGSWQTLWTLLKIGMEEQRNRQQSRLVYLIKKIISYTIGSVSFKPVFSWRWVEEGVPNKTLTTYLHKVYASKRKHDTLPFYENDVYVILTGGFVESGYVSADEYIDWLNCIIDKIEDNAKHIILKAHPAEDLTKYDPLKNRVEIITVKESIDSMMYDTKFHHYHVIGEYSTSLVTLSILYSMETYFVKSLVHRDITGLFQKLFYTYVKELK